MKILKTIPTAVVYYVLAVLVLLVSVPFEAANLVADDLGSDFDAGHSNLNYWLLGLLAGVVLTAWLGVVL